MDKDTINEWLNDCTTYYRAIQDLGILKNVLIKQMNEHLSQFFDWEKIEYADDFSKITLAWAYLHDPVIRLESIGDLGFDFIISHAYEDKLGHGIRIEIYPFGLPEEGED